MRKYGRGKKSTRSTENWTLSKSRPYGVLYNYLRFTYEKIKVEKKYALSNKGDVMCFNTGLLDKYDTDIYAIFIKNISEGKKENQDWYLKGFDKSIAPELKDFSKLSDIVDYFTDAADFIYDRHLKEPVLNFDHIIDDNIQRFIGIGLNDKSIILPLLQSAVKKIFEKLKRNYKLAVPQYYLDKKTLQSKIQLLLPLYLRSNKAELALVVDKEEHKYVGKTVLTLDMAYMNARRIVRPDSDWLNFT